MITRKQLETLRAYANIRGIRDAAKSLNMRQRQFRKHLNDALREMAEMQELECVSFVHKIDRKQLQHMVQDFIYKMERPPIA